jgi:hypothetical protein
MSPNYALLKNNLPHTFNVKGGMFLLVARDANPIEQPYGIGAGND